MEGTDGCEKQSLGAVRRGRNRRRGRGHCRLWRTAAGSGRDLVDDCDRGTFPLTGPASLYKTIPTAEKAYFDYANDQGGVNGRKINFTILDDAYDPSKTVPLTQQLVEQTRSSRSTAASEPRRTSPSGTT
jgi:hypothetical protein